MPDFLTSLLTSSSTLDALGRSAVVVALGLGASLGLRRAAAATRHALLTLTLLAAAAVPLLTLALPHWTLPVLDRPTAEIVAARPSDGAPVRRAHRSPVAVTSSPTAGVDSVAASSRTPTSATPVAPAADLTVLLLAGLWLLGVAALGGPLALGVWRMAGISRRARPIADRRLTAVLDDAVAALGLRAPVRLCGSDEVDVPVTWRRTVFLPRQAAEWTSARLRMVLLHELAHVARRDWLVLVASRAARAIYWMNPLVWPLEAALRRESERAADDRVLLAGERPSTYAAELLAIASELPSRGRQIPAVGVAAVRHSEIGDRLRAILRPAERRIGPGRGTMLAAGVTLALLLLPLASVELGARADGPLLPLLAPPSVTGAAPFEGPTDRGGRWHGTDDGEAAWDEAHDLYGEARYAEAAELFAAAAERGFRPDVAHYNAACSRSLVGDLDGALAELELALAAGFDDTRLIARDEDLDPLRSDSRFQSLLSNVDERVATGRLDEARSELDHLRAAGSDDPEAWSDLGTRLLFLRLMPEAIEAYGRALDLVGTYEGSTTRYNLACAHALAGHPDAALAALDQAVEAGFSSVEHMGNDPDLASIRGRSEFDRIRAKAELFAIDDDGDWWGERPTRALARWRESVAELRPFVEANPESARGWFTFGYALHYAGRSAEAIDAFGRALDLGFRPATTSYDIACAHAVEGRAEAALDWLRRAIDAGYDDPRHLERDSDLESLRGDPRFETMIDELEARRREERDRWHEKKDEWKRQRRAEREAEGGSV